MTRIFLLTSDKDLLVKAIISFEIKVVGKGEVEVSKGAKRGCCE